jgi:hypothetical protein
MFNLRLCPDRSLFGLGIIRAQPDQLRKRTSGSQIGKSPFLMGKKHVVFLIELFMGNGFHSYVE